MPIKYVNKAPHSVWKLPQKSHSTLRAKRASFIFRMDKQSNSVTRQVTFNSTKMGRKFQNWKIKSATFWAIFKHCVLVFYIDKKGRKRKSLIIVTLINEVAKERKRSKNAEIQFWFLLLYGIFSRSICLSYRIVKENQNHVLLVLTHNGHSVLKSPKMSHFKFWILAFSTNFCPTKSDLSGNTVWQQTSGFQTLAKLTIFGIFNFWTFKM